MSDKKNITINFNTRVSELVNMFPEHTISRSVRAKISTGMRSNAMIVLEQFIIHVLPYREKIELCDEEYFLNNDYKIDNEVVNKLIDLIKSASLLFTTDEKTIYWSHMHMLVAIADEYIFLIIK